jgi:hypothetical protein
MTNEELKEVGKLCDEIADIGRDIETKRKAVLAIVNGMVARRGESGFFVRSVRVFFGGAGARVFFEGPFLKKDGTAQARSGGSGSLSMIDKFEPAR